MSIELIVLDVDGTLTDGKITYTQNGDEVKSFSVKDGLAIASWVKLGKHVAIITGRTSHIVERRAKELGIAHFYQGIHNKKEVLEGLLEKLNLSMENVASIGDDLNDYSMLVASKLSYVPSDASIFVQKIASEVLMAKGGEAAVREMIEKLIILENLKDEYLALWE
ncbi:MAG: 3-deoxy-D-manno-octulosonate 8-phosphate phosphatase (EC [uncultured Sulfurovum sp.]|uniref:3-deoxy-D-manno-octulosonate 8-phosphate phosphatase (EC) n=1 Tax=uncultured Sulfurovum sp. TaxID=269237 RepID=A0A6S6S9Q8_9BACT|nr:MAG: 3-deoxy-D-manno-octulosonate 8-phosphate phosphatase (EC [uncultured Sulfurovum sp.]